MDDSIKSELERPNNSNETCAESDQNYCSNVTKASKLNSTTKRRNNNNLKILKAPFTQNYHISIPGYMACLILITIILSIQVSYSHATVKIEPIPNLNYKKGENLFWSCKSINSNGIKWLFPNNTVVPMSGYRFWANSQDRCNKTCILNFRDLTEKDAGSYTCKDNHDKKSKPLIVYSEPIINAPTPQNFTVNLPALVFCNATGDVLISWYKNGVMLPSTLTSTNGLNFSKIQKTDNGTYTCNIQDFKSYNSYARLIDVNVWYKPNIIDRQAGNVRATIGSQIALKCQADGNPTPEIYWFKESNIIRSGYSMDDKRISTLNRTIVDDSDFGLYFCRAENGQGASEYTFSVQKAGVPSSIRRIAFTTHDTSVDVKIVPTEESEKGISYVCRYKKAEDEWGTPEFIKKEPGQLDFVIYGLEPDTLYDFQAVPEKDNMRGPTFLANFTTTATTVTSGALSRLNFAISQPKNLICHTLLPNVLILLITFLLSR